MPTNQRTEPPATLLTVDLGIGGWRVPVHSHIACLVETEEHLAEALGFLAAGLRGSDRCIVIGEPEDNERLLRILASHGLDLASFELGGRLRVLARNLSAAAMLQDLTAAVGGAQAAGARVIRVAGILGWDREGRAPDAELFTYEAGLTDVAERWPCVILCLHEMQALSGVTTRLGVLGTHPKLVTPGGLLANRYFASLHDSPARLAEIAAELSRRQQEREALRRRSELLQTISDHIPVMVSLFDPAGRRLLFANQEWERVLGWTAEEAQRLDVLAEVFPDPAELRRAREAIRLGAREWTYLEVRARSGRFVDTSWTWVLLADGSSLGFGQDVTERKRTEERLRRSFEDLRALSARLRAVREEEDARIARQVHDEVGQLLTALRLDVAWLEQRLGPAAPLPREEIAGKLLDISRLLDSASDAVHRIAGELHPGILDELGLPAAVEWYVEAFGKRTGIACRLHSSVAAATLDPDHTTALFRILQEALTNVARHAGAAAVEIRLAAEDNRILLAITDDGRGIPEDKLGDSRSLGLLGMRERASALGGDLAVRRNSGRGTTVEVTLPP
jgi:PAS domain S-box-containing protein